jgi:5'-methylthioinosine phosphorylase
MTRIALIGGTGAMRIVPSEATTRGVVDTPYGPPSCPVMSWQSGMAQIDFIARHGPEGEIPPHRVNYRANVWALNEAAPDYILGINAVGGISSEATAGRLVFPAQIIDYTWGREHTYADGDGQSLQHIDFTQPVSEALRSRLVDQARSLGLDCLDGGTYGVTQGPRLETAAEIDRMERDGCSLVGMTAMPEASLARELNADYVICAVVVNRAAGRGTDIHAEILASLEAGMAQVQRLLDALGKS